MNVREPENLSDRRPVVHPGVPRSNGERQAVAASIDSQQGCDLPERLAADKARPTGRGPRCPEMETGGLQISASLESGAPLPAILKQISRKDVELMTDRPLRFGTRLRLALFVDLTTTSASNMAVVHWCRPGVVGWQVGAFLSSPLAEYLPVRSWCELRNQIRYESNWRAWAVWNDVTERQAVQITNYSVSGIRISCGREIPVGSRFTLYQSYADSSPELLEGYVQWSRKSSRGYLAGCYVFHERARYLPRVFNQSSTLHVEIPDQPATSFSNPMQPHAVEYSPDHFLA